MKNESEKYIPADVLAAFLDGNASALECQMILNTISEDAGLRELLHVSQLVDVDMGVSSQECDSLPTAAMAATCDEGAYCSLECEKYVLNKFGIMYDEAQLLANAILNGWQEENGTALQNIGRHLEGKGLIVTRKFKCSIKDIEDTLNANACVIVAVDGGELSGESVTEIREDLLIGQVSDHAVVVKSYDAHMHTITIYDPNSSNREDVYHVEIFEDAWSDSANYMVTVSVN